MRALFAHDHVFVNGHGNTVYAEGQFAYSTWARYLDVFDEITVAGRVRELKESDTIHRLNVSIGPRVFFVFVSHLANPWAMLTRRRRAVRILTEAIASVDAVIVRVPSETGVLAAMIAKRLNKPWAVEVVGCAWAALWNYGNWQGKVYAPVMMERTRRVVSKAPFVIYTTSQFLQQRYPTLGYSAFASNVQISPPETAVLEKRLAKLRQPHERLVFGLIGSLQTKYKGVQTAMAALGMIRNRLPPFEFRVLGKGDPQPWQALAECRGVGDCVRFCGVLPSGERVLKWLDEVDIYLQPSFTEGLSRSLIEAMSRACPALATTTGGTPELLPSGCLHRPGNATRLGELIVSATQNTDWQTDQAKINFATSKAYGSDVLDARRGAFWRAFANVVRGQTGHS